MQIGLHVTLQSTIALESSITHFANKFFVIGVIVAMFDEKTFAESHIVTLITFWELTVSWRRNTMFCVQMVQQEIALAGTMTTVLTYPSINLLHVHILQMTPVQIVRFEVNWLFIGST